MHKRVLMILVCLLVMTGIHLNITAADQYEEALGMSSEEEVYTEEAILSEDISSEEANLFEEETFIEELRLSEENIELPIAEEASMELLTGDVNETISWSLSAEGVLTISGSGSMPTLGFLQTASWAQDIKDSVVKIIVESGVKDICFGAFPNLESVELAEGVESLGASAFSSCSKLTMINFPESLQRIGDYAFSVTGFTELTIPNVELGKRVVGGCKSLETLVLSEGIDEIPESFAWNCSKLNNVTIPGTVKTIGWCAFRACSSLKEVTIPEGTEKLMGQVFHLCNGLETIHLSSTVDYLGEAATSDQDMTCFYSCSSLKTIDLSSENRTYKVTDGVLFSKDGSRLICYPAALSASAYTVPSTVTTIGSGAFSNAVNLKSIELNEGLTKIYGGAFNYTNLEEITLPSTLTEIDGLSCGGEVVGSFPESIKKYTVLSESIVSMDNLLELKADSFFEYVGRTDVVVYSYSSYPIHEFAIQYSISFVALDNQLTSISVPVAANYTYDGEIHYGLSNGEGYLISGKNKVRAAGTYSVTISLQAGYEWLDGTSEDKVLTFTVSPRNISNAKAELIETSCEYTGSSIKPAVTLTDIGKTLAAGTDYKVSYKNNKSLGIASVTITGIGNYTGSLTKNFKIIPKTVSMYAPDAAARGETIKWKAQSNVTGYQIYRRSGSGSYEKLVTIKDASVTSYTDRGLTNGRRYAYKVRAYYKTVDGKTLYGEFSAGKAVYYLAPVSITELLNSKAGYLTIYYSGNNKGNGYQIQIAEDSAFTVNVKTINVTKAETVKKTISGLTKGKTYYVRIAAYKTVDGKKYFSSFGDKKKLKLTK